MAVHASVSIHTWTAASYETAAAIESVLAASGSGVDASPAWSLLRERAQAVISLYDLDGENLESSDLALLGPLLLRTAEEFRHLIESHIIPPDDPRAVLYDEFADRAELVAL